MPAALMMMVLAAPAFAQPVELYDRGEPLPPSSPPVTWPNFVEHLGEEEQLPPILPPPGSSDGVLRSTTVISAPLPPAVATGLFMLAGNWVVTRLWQKRKI